MTDLARLEEVARAATQGEWDRHGWTIWAPDAKANIARVSELRATRTVGFTEPEFGSPNSEEIAANAAHIAAFDPPTALALLAALAAVKEYTQAVDAHRDLMTAGLRSAADGEAFRAGTQKCIELEADYRAAIRALEGLKP